MKALRKNAHICLMNSLEKAIWNWLDTYPNEFADLQKNPNEELIEIADKLFDQLEVFAESNKRKAQAWPLQIMLLLLIPPAIEEIAAAENGLQCGQRHLKKVCY